MTRAAVAALALLLAACAVQRPCPAGQVDLLDPETRAPVVLCTP